MSQFYPSRQFLRCLYTCTISHSYFCMLAKTKYVSADLYIRTVLYLHAKDMLDPVSFVKKTCFFVVY